MSPKWSGDVQTVEKMSDDMIQGVVETIDSANQHQLRLAELLSGLEDAKTQIQQSAGQSRAKLQQHFAQLRTDILAALEQRLTVLEGQVDEIEAGALGPLSQCEDMIQQDINSARDVLQEGKQLLSSDHASHKEDLENFCLRTCDLGLSSLPEVPSLADVACIFTDLPESPGSQLVAEIHDYGRVISRAPVQITDIIERPGSLFVRWAETEEESSLDLSEFRLECDYGSSRTSGCRFQQLYRGPATTFTLRNARPGTTYMFRVAGRTEGAQVWSPWSIPHTGMTTLQHYQWRSDVPGYVTSNENKLVRRCLPLGTPAEQNHIEDGPILYSTAASYTCGHSLVFKVAEDGPCCQGDGVALSTTCDLRDTFCRQGALLVSASGAVFIDGQEKTTKLPCLKRGSVLTFDTEVLQSGKVRVTIEVNERIVTFDWAVESPTRAMRDIQLYFAMRFACVGWVVGVE